MAYDEVQREACDYVNKAARYNFHLVTGCGNYPLWEVWSWHDNGTVIKTKERPDLQEALDLRGEGPRIRGKIEDVKRALRDLGLSDSVFSE